MNNRLTDTLIICEFMETNPALPDFYYYLRPSRLGWWKLGPYNPPKTGQMRWYPIELTLDELHKVESRLTEERWRQYEENLKGLLASAGHSPSVQAWVSLTAEFKTEALASVLKEKS